MKTSFPMFGYHGCSRETARRVILSHEYLTPSSDKNEWLGEGIYFWNNDPKRALEWAKHKGFKEPYVVGAIIAPERVLDFSTREAEPLVQKSYAFLKALSEIQKTPLPKNTPYNQKDKFYKNRCLDCSVMNTLLSMTKGKYDVFSAPFLEGDPIYETGFFLSETHVQICVKKHSAIAGYFIPSEAETLGLPPLF